MSKREQTAAKVLKEVQACASVAEALNALLDCVGAIVWHNIENPTDRGTAMDACSARLKEIKKHIINLK